MNKKYTKVLLNKYGVRPSKKFGQNFLINNKVVKKVIKAAKLKINEIILEIGPGIGNLTKELAKKVKKVIAVEKDPKMCQILKETLKDFRNIEIINQDILKLKFQITNSKLQINSKFKIPKIYKIVANLPFYIVSPVIRKFLENTQVRPVQMILMVQKEVAQRIAAKPPKMNLLAVSVQFYAKPEIISYVSKSSFWPKPKVDSAIIRITPFDSKKVFACAHSHFASRRRASAFRMLFFQIVKAGFSHPRKQLANNLSKGLALSSPNGLKLNKPSQILKGKTWAGKAQIIAWLKKNKIQPSQRAETLSISDWIKLAKNFSC